MPTFLRSAFAVALPFCVLACGGDDNGGPSGGDGGGGRGGSPGTGGDSSGSSSGGGGAGGGSETTDHEFFGSGARLRAMYIDAGDGAVRFSRWMDTELGIQCSFLRADDGSMRCFPITLAAADTYFGDDGCTEHLASYTVSSCAEHTHAGVLSTTSACIATMGNVVTSDSTATKRAVHELGGEHTGKTYRRSGDNCVEYAASVVEVVRKLGAAVPPSRYVRAEIEKKKVGPAEVEVLRGEDGSFLYGLTDDAESHAYCNEVGGRCMPSFMAGVVGAFWDAACQIPVASQWNPNDNCKSPTLVMKLEPNDDVCSGSEFSFFGPGSEIDAASVYTVSGTCKLLSTVQSNYADYRFYEIGAATKASGFRMTDLKRGTGRVRSVGQSADGGDALITRPTSFIDTKTGLTCDVSLGGNGKLYCVSKEATLPAMPTFFADPGCFSGLAYTVKNACLSKPPEATYALTYTTDSGCTQGIAFRSAPLIRSAVPFEGQVYQKTGDVCGPSAGTDEFYDFYLPGAQVTPDDFPEFQIVTE